jgi:hypothetical protein
MKKVKAPEVRIAVMPCKGCKLPGKHYNFKHSSLKDVWTFIEEIKATGFDVDILILPPIGADSEIQSQPIDGTTNKEKFDELKKYLKKKKVTPPSKSAKPDDPEEEKE